MKYGLLYSSPSAIVWTFIPALSPCHGCPAMQLLFFRAPRSTGFSFVPVFWRDGEGIMQQQSLTLQAFVNKFLFFGKLCSAGDHELPHSFLLPPSRRWQPQRQSLWSAQPALSCSAFSVLLSCRYGLISRIRGVMQAPGGMV